MTLWFQVNKLYTYQSGMNNQPTMRTAMSNDLREEILRQYDVESHIMRILWMMGFEPADTGMLDRFMGEHEEILVEVDVNNQFILVYVTPMDVSPKRTASMTIDCLPLVQVQTEGETRQGIVLLTHEAISSQLVQTVDILVGARA